MLGFNIFRAFCVRLQSLSVIITGRGIHRNVGDDLAVDLHIDLINAAAQIFVVFRRDAVVLQQALFKLDLPCFLRAGGRLCCRCGLNCRGGFLYCGCLRRFRLGRLLGGRNCLGRRIVSTSFFSQPAKARSSTATRMAAASSLQVSSKLSIVLFVSFIVNTPCCLIARRA